MQPFLPEPLRVVEEPPPSSPRAELAPRAPQPRLWWEIVAVLCIAVFPQIANAVFGRLIDPGPISSTLDSVMRITRSVFVIYAVLFVLRSSGVPRSAIGLTRPAWSDLLIAAVLFAIDLGVSSFLHQYVEVAEAASTASIFGVPQTIFDHTMIVIAVLLSAFAEELVVRGYLIARLDEATGSLGVALVAAAALFASYHVYQGFGATIHVFVGGLLYGLGFVLIRRLWPFVFGHALWNLAIAYDIFGA